MPRAAVEIKFVDVGAITPDSNRAGIVWQPFGLEAYDQSGTSVFSVGVSHDESLLPRLRDLYRTHGEQAVRAAIVRWAIRRTDQVVRSGVFSTDGDALEIDLRAWDLLLIGELASQKTCRYQTVIDGDLFCSAADRQADATKIAEHGLRALAPTSRPLCRRCELPDTDFICSHLLFPRVVGSALLEGTPDPKVPTFRRRLLGSFCDVDQTCVGTGANCRPGGNPCWERSVLPEALKAAVPVSPRELPMAFDFLDATWRLAFGRSLLRIRSAEAVAGLVLRCPTREEFAQRLSELADLIKLMEISDDLLPDDKRTLNKSETLKRLGAVLALKFGGEQTGASDGAIKILQAINKTRRAFQHSGASRDLPVALAELGITYPIEDYGQAWDVVRAHAVESLSTIRKVVRSGAESW